MTKTQQSDATSSEGATLETELTNLLSSAVLVLLGGLVASAAKLVERVLIGTVLSPSLYGEVSMAIAILTFGNILSMVGLSQGVPRYLSRVETLEERRGVWFSGLVVAGVLSLLVALGVWTLSDWLAAQFFETPTAPRLIQLFALSLPLMVGFKISIAAIRGHENTIYKTYVGDLLFPGGRVLFLGLLLYLGYGVFAAGYAYIALSALTLVASYYFLHRLMPLVGPVRTRVREMMRFSAPLVVSIFLSMLLMHTDTLMMGYFRSSNEVGIYNAAYPIAGSLLIALSAFGFLYLPLVSRLDSNGDRDDIGDIYALTTKWVFIITFPPFLLFAVFPAEVLSTVFGPEYARGSTALATLSVGFFVSAIAGRTRETTSALGATTVILAANVVAFVTNFGLNLVLIPAYSYDGAAVASAVANVLLNCGLYAILWLKFDVTPFSRWSRRTFLVVPAALLPPAVALSYWVPVTPLLIPVLLVGTAIACLVVVTVTGCLQPEDRIVVEKIENAVGYDVPVVRRYIPDSDGDVEDVLS